MRVVSLNAWGGAVFDALADWLPRCGADVLCLQEVTHTVGLAGWTRFDDGERTLPQRASLIDDVRALLPRYQAMFVSCDSGPVFDEAGNRHRQEFGIALFVHDRLPIVHTETAFVHGAYQAHDEWPHSGRPRQAQGVRIVDTHSGRVIAVTHLHGLRDAAGKGDTPARVAQAHRLATLSERVGQGADVAVVCGDLNLLPTSTTFAILAAAGLTDLIGTADTRTSRYRKDVRHANYMLVSEPSTVLRCEAPAVPEVSDHRYLVLEL